MPKYTERAPGVYHATFVKLDTDYKLTDKETGEELTRWRWVWQEVSDPTTVGELDTITSTSFKARTNGLKLFTGMLGRAPKDGDDTDSLIGQEFNVVYGPNQNGRYTVTGASPAKSSADSRVPKAAVDAAAAQHGLQEDPTDLPF